MLICGIHQSFLSQAVTKNTNTTHSSPTSQVHPFLNIVTPIMADNEAPWLDDEGPSSSTLENLFAVNDENETYSVYFDGCVSHQWFYFGKEEGEAEKITEVGIGVVICDSMDNLVLQLGKRSSITRDVSPLEAKLEALIEGLMAAKELKIENLLFFCKNLDLYNYLNISLHHDNSSSIDSKEGLKVKTEEELKLRQKIEMIKHLRERLKKGRPRLVLESNTRRRHKHASKLARDADSFSDHVEIVKRTCEICLEQTDILQMLSVHDCLHKRCLSCVKKHIEVNLREGILPTCPHEGCKSSIKIRACKKILSPELVEVLEHRLQESQIPVLDRIYCPYPKCSNLMGKEEVLRYSKLISRNATISGYRKCLKCHGEFCVDCKVPWHREMTCFDYKKLHPYSCAEEEMFISLAQRHSWRKCIKCSQMIELAAGCYHVICRCGYQFCYSCGKEWHKDKACGCPLWDERLIIY